MLNDDDIPASLEALITAYLSYLETFPATIQAQGKRRLLEALLKSRAANEQ